MSLVCRKTVQPTPTNYYARRSHFMYCCVGNCTINPNKNNQQNNEEAEALDSAAGTVCACAAEWDFANDENPDVPPHNADPEHEEEVVQPLQFPFTPAGMTGFRDAGPNLKNEEPNELKRKP